MSALIGEASAQLDLDPKFVHSIVAQASYLYKAVEIPKHQGGHRTIHMPAPELRVLQRWLLRRVVDDFRVHRCATAYRPKLSTRSTATPHAGAPYLLRLDVRHFFPSITAADIRAYWSRRRTEFPESWDDSDIHVFIQLVCRRGRLTIGAPTSPALSNALCLELDALIETLGVQRSFNYTRYADDMFFSAQHAGTLATLEQDVAGYLVNLPFPKGLRLNPEKTVFMHNGVTRRIVGLVVSDQGDVSIPRELRREIRGLLHNFDRADANGIERLQGLLSYAKSVDSKTFDRFSKMFPRQVEAALKPVARQRLLEELRLERLRARWASARHIHEV
jgi:RNA-directed DNA polymerase